MLSAEQDGKGGFVVRVLGEADGKERLGVNVIGLYSGTHARAVNPAHVLAQSRGPHRIQITTNGSWRVSLRQRMWTTRTPRPGTYAGT